MKQRNKAVPAVYLILEKNGAILMMKRYNTGYQDGNFGLPSGHVEINELPLAAMVRELEEELGVRVKKDDLKLVHTLYRAAHDETGERLDLFFAANRWEGEPKNREPQKCDDLQWFSLANLPNNMVPYIRFVLEKISENAPYSEGS